MLKEQLEQYILATLNYFDIFEYPLTLFEIRKNLIDLDNVLLNKDCADEGCPTPNRVSDTLGIPTITDIEDALNGERLKKIAGQNNGFYFLACNNSNYLTRQKRYYLADKKFKRAKKIVWMFGKIHYIKMIAVCNSLGYSNAREDSDIDLFVVTAKNRVWVARFLSVMLIKFLNLRPKEGRVKDTICMSFFVDENNLNLEKFKISENDIYLTFWVTQIFPIYDRDNIYEKFFKENDWVKKTLPHAVRREVEIGRKIFPARESPLGDSRGADNSPQSPLGDCGVAGSNWLEKFSKKIQLKFMSQRLKELVNKDTRVVINDGVLKLFAVDRREEYMERWSDSFKLFL